VYSSLDIVDTSTHFKFYMVYPLKSANKRHLQRNNRLKFTLQQH